MNTRSLLRFLAFAVLITSGAPSVFSGVEEVTVQVDGLSCPFCAYNIEKRVRRLEGLPRARAALRRGYRGGLQIFAVELVHTVDDPCVRPRDLL